MISIKDKNVFLSGPMTGIEHCNVEALAKAHAQLKELGAASVYNPAIEYLLSHRSESHEFWMRKSMDAITNGWYDSIIRQQMKADILVQLKGWSKSEGCRTEATVASACGVPCVSMKRVLRDAEEKKPNPHKIEFGIKNVQVAIKNKDGSYVPIELAVDDPWYDDESHASAYDTITEA